MVGGAAMRNAKNGAAGSTVVVGGVVQTITQRTTTAHGFVRWRIGRQQSAHKLTLRECSGRLGCAPWLHKLPGSMAGVYTPALPSGMERLSSTH